MSHEGVSELRGKGISNTAMLYYTKYSCNVLFCIVLYTPVQDQEVHILGLDRTDPAGSSRQNRFKSIV